MCSFSTQNEPHCHALHHATFYIRYIEYMKMLSHLFLMVHKAKYESSVSLTHIYAFKGLSQALILSLILSVFVCMCTCVLVNLCACEWILSQILPSPKSKQLNMQFYLEAKNREKKTLWGYPPFGEAIFAKRENSSKKQNIDL